MPDQGSGTQVTLRAFPEPPGAARRVVCVCVRVCGLKLQYGELGFLM